MLIRKGVGYTFYSMQKKKIFFYLVRFSKMSFFRFFDGSLMAPFWRLLVWSSTRSTCNRSQTHIIGIIVTFFRICRQSLAIMIYTKYMIIEKQLKNSYILRRPQKFEKNRPFCFDIKCHYYFLNYALTRIWLALQINLEVVSNGILILIFTVIH